MRRLPSGGKRFANQNLSSSFTQKIKQTMKRTQTAPAVALPPGNEPLFSVTCKDVVLGRGSGTQNHCGNVTYRKLVYLNKELYATSSKFDKLKISKAIVAAVREFGGNFVQADQKRGGLYYDIGDKRAWDKTSQALREGQAEIRQHLATADPSGPSVAEYKQVISEQTFFAYACRVLESLYHPNDGVSGFSACGQQCRHAKRRETLNQLGVDPMTIHQAMQTLSRATPTLPPTSTQLPPPQDMQRQQSFAPHDYTAGMLSAGDVAAATASTPQTQNQMQPFQEIAPLPFAHGIYVNSVASAPVGGIAPLPYAPAPPPPNTTTMPGGYPNDLLPSEIPSSTMVVAYQNPLAEVSARETNREGRGAAVVPGTSLKTLPFQNQSQGDQTSLDPLPFQNQSQGEQTCLDPLPFHIQSQGDQASLETLPFQNQSQGDQKPRHDRESGSSYESAFSLRKFCSTDVQITTEEGKTLMQQLSTEVDDLIRRKSYALLQIDTGRAFEDLVFEDDSVTFDRPKPNEAPCSNKGESSSSSGRSRRSSTSSRSTQLSRMSRLSSKDDMSLMSLMNLSILSLDERGYGSDGHIDSHMGGSNLKEEEANPKPIIKHNSPPDTTTQNQKNAKTPGRVSWAEESNVSLMSLNDQSFKQLLECICDPEECAEQEKKTQTKQHVSRKMGFPIGRNAVAAQFNSASAPKVEQMAEQHIPGAILCGSRVSLNGSDRKPNRFLTIAEGDDSLSRSGSSSSRVTGLIENLGTDNNSLRLNGARTSDTSQLSMMSIGSFSRVAGLVDNPGTDNNSFRLSGVRTSDTSQMSRMSTGSYSRVAGLVENPGTGNSSKLDGEEPQMGVK